MRGRGPKDSQLPLDFPPQRSFSREDFLVTACNADAVAAVEGWPEWATTVLFLVGPSGSGKSHLGEIWRSDTGARHACAPDLTIAAMPELLSSGALLVEDASATSPGERPMFHLLNLAREHRARLLVTTTEMPARWPVSLPDLGSRLRAAGTAVLEPPDDALLRAVLAKLFADRRIAADDSLLSYLVNRIERSFDAAGRIVGELDRRALAEKVKVSRALAARVLADSFVDGD